MKKVVLIVAMLLMIPLSNVSANTIFQQTGAFNQGLTLRQSDVTGKDIYTIWFDTNDVIGLKFQQYTQGFGELKREVNTNAIQDGHSHNTGVNFRCNDSYRVWAYDINDNEIGYVELTITDLVDPECDVDDPEPDDGTGDDGSCGCVIDIPGWGDMMGKLDEIKNAIPPAPNWQQVANTMRDTIVPAFRDEMEDMLGRAPEPSSPPVFNNPLQGGVDEPTGSLPADFEDSGFTANDLKSDAEQIQFQEDQSGGFELLDPVGSLPTQEEFKDNIPAEQELQAPEVPDVTGTAPEPPAQENIAPEPPDVTGTAPNPGNQDNVAPTPPDVTGTAPKPSEQENVAPSPSEGENVAPTPGDSNNTAPLPGGDSGTAPVPSDDLTTAPLPSDDLTGAPIPNTE